MVVMAMSERDKTDLGRLLERELTEIPRVRDALRAWADDAYLAGHLHRLKTEAAVLRESLAVRSASTTPLPWND
jgi:hypothetical protein